ncbi:MAG: UDP-N-acetylmuramoyl-L-alanine--D-glutamate ligase [Polyangiaceae bacterium]|nr:UDP-N-acetylmuramoyl-L-alanine--D-glutamate ligase [Polyangiaceae bacterium]
MSLNWKSKNVVVVGLGVSGIAACKLLAARGAHVVGTDKKPRRALSDDVALLESLGVTLALGGHEDAGMLHADLVIVSPGVPSSELATAEARGVPIWGEVELAVRELNAWAQSAGRPAPRVVAIGGTNGKSTTTSLVGELLAAHGLRTFCGGNLGEPLASHASEAFDAVVLEVSSFQMERAETFHPHVSVLLNITPDHLDRYPSFDAYANAKGNAFLRQEPSDIAVVPFADSMCEAQAKRGRAKVVSFGPGGDFDVTPSAVVDRASCAAPTFFERAKMHLQGGHNALNVAAALAAVSPFGVSPETIRTVLANFKGLAHRMSLVAEHAGVRYYDDSKGTNVGASVTAVRGVVEPKVVAILGGRDKGGSYEPLVRALADKGRAAVVIGEAADAIAHAVGNVVPVHRAGSMGEAVTLSAALAQPGDAVLLSPACSSFDMFVDYKHRGDAFVAAVKDLERGSP